MFGTEAAASTRVHCHYDRSMVNARDLEDVVTEPLQRVALASSAQAWSLECVLASPISRLLVDL